MLDDVSKLSTEEIEQLLPKLDQMIKWAEDVKKYALNKALQGTKFKGYKLVAGRSNRQVSDPKKMESILRELQFDEDKIFTKKLIGVPAIEKLISGVCEEHQDIVKGLIIKPKGKPTLVISTDKRPEYSDMNAEFKELLNINKGDK